MHVNIIGGGLAGCECANILAKYGIKVKLYEMKKIKKTEAHTKEYLAELVCSNSLKSSSVTNACGLLKEEMKMLDSILVSSASMSKVEAGQALAVDRDKFSTYITDKIYNSPNIQVISKEVQDFSDIEGFDENITVFATGPLTSEKLFENLVKYIKQDSLYFYDAAAPIIEADSIDMNIAYIKDRYGEVGIGDYINLPLEKDEYFLVYNELVKAELAPRKEFDKLEFFEGCMPIEELARRGEKTLTFGPLKPVGLEKIDGKRPYAVVQLRAENDQKTMYNMVGFQTSLKFGEQDRVFKMIPGLENANILRYGVMHKNKYINAPKILDRSFKVKEKDNIYFAGQISGVEGYVESAASGLMVAYHIIASLKGFDIVFPDNTILGSLSRHISEERKDYQPMNANFGIVPPLENRVKDKKEKYQIYANRSIKDMKDFSKDLLSRI